MNTGKFTNAEKILAPFKTGSETTEVIINLSDTSPRQRTQWKSLQSRRQQRERIRSRQQQFLDSLPGDLPLMRHRLKNQPTLSAHVTSDVLKKLSVHPMIESIEPVIYFQPYLRQGIARMNAAETRMTYSGQGVAIAICDTGIDYTHPRLGGGGFPNSKVIGGYDVGDNDANPAPEGEAHGTACAGIAAGNLGSTGDYIGGVAWNAKLYALKITEGSSGYSSNADIAAAWDWCVTHQYDDPNNPIMVISTSFGGERYYNNCDSSSYSLRTAAQNATAAGITLLASSGNEGYCDSLSSPACFSNVISVGAVYDAYLGSVGFCVEDGSCAPENGTFSCDTGTFPTRQTTGADVVTVYSNTASFLDILAPSHDAYTTDIVGSAGYAYGDYDTEFGGTSAACPYAAGAVACLQSAAMELNGEFLTPQEVKALLTSSGDDVTDDKVAITKPRVNLAAAVAGLRGVPPTASDAAVPAGIDTPVTITLDASDDGQPEVPGRLSYIITSLPNHGLLSEPNTSVIDTVPYVLAGNGNVVHYSPKAGCLAPAIFTFKANDGGTAPEGGDSNQAQIQVAFPTKTVIYGADMNTDPNWTFSSPSDWAWGVPTGGGGEYGYADPTAGATGNKVVGYNLFGDYDNSLDYTEWATTPAFDCSGKTGVTLEFMRWLNVEENDYDDAFIEVSNDGLFWTNVWNNPYEVTDSSWTPQTIDISVVADNQPTVYVRWGIGPTDSSWAYSGWNIDDVVVTGDAAVFTPLAGDLEPDCDVDADDLARLIAYWLQTCGNCEGADLIEDGIVNLKDLQALAKNWLATN